MNLNKKKKLINKSKCWAFYGRKCVYKLMFVESKKRDMLYEKEK